MPIRRFLQARREKQLLKETTGALNRLRRYSAELPGAVRGRAGAIAGAPLAIDIPDRVLGGSLAAAWLGHATVLVRIGGMWVLTDPVFSSRIGVPIGPMTLGLSRLQPPPDPATLPPIDLVLLSHAHFDHLDKPTLRRLCSPSTTVIAAVKTGRLVPRGFGAVHELPWDGELRVGPLTVRAMRPRHWGARLSVDTHRGFNSYVIDSGERRVLFAGDTARTDVFVPLAREGKAIDLSIFGIGAYDPWVHHHATPEQAWEMHTESGGKFLMPMHHSTFKLSDEPRDEPLRRLLAAAGEGVERIVGRDLGRVWEADSAG
jgi:L-ascorbate metabolism protein UlaG (beta-lactamase superfamily)